MQLSVVMRPRPTLSHRPTMRLPPQRLAFLPPPPPPQGRDGNWGLCSLSSEGPVTVELGSVNPHQRDRGRSCSQDSLPPLTITPQKRAHPWDTGWPPGLGGAGPRLGSRLGSWLGSRGHGQQNCVWLVGHGGYVNMVSPLIISHFSVPSCKREYASD